jgi:hypothetical protein
MIRRASLALVLLAFGSSLWAQSLGTAAENEKKRRESVDQEKKHAPKVFTDDDLARYSGGAPLDAAGEPKAEASPKPSAGSKKGGAAPAEPSSTETSDAAKRRIAAELKPRIQQCEADLPRAKQELKEAEAQWATLERYLFGGYSVDQARQRLDNARSSLKATQDACDAIEDRVRREGIPPGWVR